MPSLVSINVNIFIWKIRVFQSLLTVTSLLLTIETSSNHNKNVNKTWTNNLDNNHSFIYLQWNLDLTNLYITKDFLQPSKYYIKMYGTEPRFNEILLIITTNTIQNPNRKLYLGITNKCEHMIKKKAKQTNKDKIYAYSSFKQFCLPFLEFLVPYSSVLHHV